MDRPFRRDRRLTPSATFASSAIGPLAEPLKDPKYAMRISYFGKAIF
jgi:hypothetical protein